MTERFYEFDPASVLETKKDMAIFLAEAMKTGDARYIASAIGVVARAKGMTEIAKETGLSREQLYKSFSENGNPTLKTTLAVLSTLGVTLSATVP